MDNVKPTIDIIYPITDAYVNSNSFSYKLSETVVEGLVSWFGTEGGDFGVTKEIQLLGPELIGPNAENNFDFTKIEFEDDDMITRDGNAELSLFKEYFSISSLPKCPLQPSAKTVTFP